MVYVQRESGLEFFIMSLVGVGQAVTTCGIFLMPIMLASNAIIDHI